MLENQHIPLCTLEDQRISYRKLEDHFTLKLTLEVKIFRTVNWKMTVPFKLRWKISVALNLHWKILFLLTYTRRSHSIYWSLGKSCNRHGMIITIFLSIYIYGSVCWRICISIYVHGNIMVSLNQGTGNCATAVLETTLPDHK